MVGIPTNVLMPALIAFFAVALATASVALIFEWLQEQRRKRRMVGELRTLADEPLDPSGRGPLLRSAILDSPWLRPIAARMPALQDLELMLQQGQIGWTLQTLLLMCLGGGLAMGLLTLMLLQFLPVAIIMAALGASLPTMYVRFR